MKTPEQIAEEHTWRMTGDVLATLDNHVLMGEAAA